jgi:hypothetical protein
VRQVFFADFEYKTVAVPIEPERASIANFIFREISPFDILISRVGAPPDLGAQTEYRPNGFWGGLY